VPIARPAGFTDTFTDPGVAPVAGDAVNHAAEVVTV
jgi:hypothetical protein